MGDAGEQRLGHNSAGQFANPGPLTAFAAAHVHCWDRHDHARMSGSGGREPGAY